MDLETSEEAKRLQEVYRLYDLNASVRQRRAPSNPGNCRIRQQRSTQIRGILGDHHLIPLRDSRILDVGCGNGSELNRLLQLGAVPEMLHGVDLLPDRIEDARRRYPGIRFLRANAELLEFPDGTFDLVLAFTVFSSILEDGMAHRVAAEVCRVLKPGGSVLWYDLRYNNPRNRHVRAVSKGRIGELFEGFELDLRTTTLLPPLARCLGAATPVLYPMLSWMPLLRTHYIGILSKSC